MAVVGTTIFYMGGNPYYSPEFGRGGLSATFVVETLNLILTGANQVEVTVETRNSEDATFTTAGVFPAIVGTGVTTVDVTGLLEIVRFRYEFTGGTPTADDGVHFLMQAPSWRPY